MNVSTHPRALMKRLALIQLLGIAALTLFAQQDAQPLEDDGAGRGVARLSVMNGEVSVRRGDSGDFVAAAINAPLVVTDRVVTGPQSRAEVQFDWANMIRIGSNSEVRLSELEYRRYQIQIALGTTTFRVLRQSNADVEISTPSVSVRPLGIGVFRVMVREDGSSEITVRSGEAEIFTARGSERVRTGSTMLARGTVQDPEFRDVAAIPVDEWDRWNADRDRDLERSHSYQYVSSEISGAEDLEGHGRWVSAEGYGNVWAPTVDTGWAPYRYGRWVWEDYYGWTWVSYDPWGWAPYHYGRWFNSPLYGWCWWPGGIHERHHWRPALVAFFGWGSHNGSRSGSWGNVGWVPLAPHETFHPWYGRGRGTTVIGNSNITGLYRNARLNHGITAVNSDVFGRRGITRGDVIGVSGDQLRNAGLVRGALPVTPGRESLHLADRGAAASTLSRNTDNRSFFSKQPSRIVERGSQTGGWRRADEPANQPAVDRGNPSYRSAPAQEQGVWHRFGDPVPHSSLNPGTQNQNTPTTPAPNLRQQDNGWRRFSGTESPGYRSTPPPSQPPPQDRSAPRDNNRPASRSDTGRTDLAPARGPYDGSQAVRINPPMVRERPSGGSREYSGSRPQNSAPQPPRNTAPAQAPRSSGDGGASRSNGNRSSDGGGNRGR
jgi:hypothetical protein